MFRDFWAYGVIHADSYFIGELRKNAKENKVIHEVYNG